MSEKIYGWLLKLYPARFRETYGASAMQLFRDRLHAERGLMRRFRFWLDLIADLAKSIPHEYRRQNSTEPDLPGYRLSEAAVASMSKRTVVTPTLSFCVFLVLGLAAGWLGNSHRLLLLAAYIPLTILGMMRFSAIGRFKKRWRNYELIMETDRVLQRLHGQDLTVLRSEVGRIIESPQGLRVVGGLVPRVRAIVVPADLSGYQQVRELLSQWMPITQQPELWLSDPRPLLGCILALLPATLMVRSLAWFLTLTLGYYGLVVLGIMTLLARPLNSSWKPGPRRRGLDLAPPRHMWRRFKGQCRRRQVAVVWLIILALITLPALKAVAAILTRQI
jgi:hypothetical protein